MAGVGLRREAAAAGVAKAPVRGRKNLLMAEHPAGPGADAAVLSLGLAGMGAALHLVDWTTGLYGGTLTARTAVGGGAQHAGTLPGLLPGRRGTCHIALLQAVLRMSALSCALQGRV